MTELSRTPEKTYEEAVECAILSALDKGVASFDELIKHCSGADPVFVSSVLKNKNIKFNDRHNNITAYGQNPDDPRFFLRLPAPNPELSQWWFASESIQAIAERSIRACGQCPTPSYFCLGAPTVGHYLGMQNRAVSILDIDKDVLATLTSLPNTATTHVYDAAGELPQELVGCATAAIIDPPWYKSALRLFICRALQALQVKGELICTLPPVLIRPDVQELRDTLINDLLTCGHRLISLEEQAIKYSVPRFELAALKRNIPDFQGLPWRYGDLLHIRKMNDRVIEVDSTTTESWEVFARQPTEFRVFLRLPINNEKYDGFDLLNLYSNNISSRAHVGEKPDLCSSEKIGIKFNGGGQEVRAVLTCWVNSSKTREDAVNMLTDTLGSEFHAKTAVNLLDENLGLWTKFAVPPPLRDKNTIEKIKAAALTSFATHPSDRGGEEATDNYRAAFQRDRDRILWSQALRRLSNKTQLFPSQYDDHLRQRLTHSIEVYQLAATIGTSFGLDPDLIEAGALAHDIGHTPFGHAGEHALAKLFNTINPQLAGFNHYEHGVDIARWLEGPYYVSGTSNFFGMNLTAEVLECILKHTYCHSGSGFTTEELLKQGKHADLIVSGYCHLEGQAVRVADKISYLVSDIEDGIRLGVIEDAHLASCRFFHRSPLTLLSDNSIPLYDRFLAQRRYVLKLLMEDVLLSTSKRLATLGAGAGISAVRNADDYMINHSDEMATEVAEIWNKLQVARLHADQSVISANLTASRIIAELTLAYAVMPQLIENRFLMEHRRLWESVYLKFYRVNVGSKVIIPRSLYSFMPLHTMIGTEHRLNDDIKLPVEQLVTAKDYVASLSDSRARQFHVDLFLRK